MQVTYTPGNQTVQARAGDTLLDAALDNGIALPHECGGNCACTTCHVVVEAGAENLSRPEEVENDRLIGAQDLVPASRLACQAILQGGDVTVWIVASD